MTLFLIFCPEGFATCLGSVRPDLPGGRTGNLQNRRSALGPALTFPNSPAILIFDIFSTDSEYVEDKPRGMWLSPTSHLGTGGSLYPCGWPSVSPPLLPQ